MPKMELFENEGYYYSTLFHELTHSTGHKTRLAREGVININGFGTNEYSKEEIIAELGASYLCALTHIPRKTIENSSAYIDYWLKCLREDNKFIFKVMNQAQKAVNYIMGEVI